MARTVLFIDDEAEVTRGLRRVLRKSPYRVLTANSVAEAERLLSVEAVDVMVSDEKMPHTLGSSFLAAQRQARPDITRVMLTGHGDMALMTKAINEVEVFRFLSKPVPPEALRACIDEAFEARERYLAWTEHEDRAAAEREQSAHLDDALERLTCVVQPIVAHDGTLSGWEGLTRPPEGGAFAHVGELFATAAALGRTHEIERRVRWVLAAVAARVPRGVALFVNLEVSSLDDPELFDPKARLSRVAERVVLEVTERAPLPAPELLDDKVTRLRALGYRLALDDFGAGTAGFTALSTLRPDVVKFDMELVRDVHRMPSRAHTLRMMRELCRSVGALALAEGVEREEELAVLRDIGFDLYQGFLIGRPGPPFPSFRARY
ncbi:MAG: hypothetical protein CSA66_03995 [Proteobacteria bacterium]|nr:MAG: hypothetical protein CSA66_03995 [Pseudomonadota bacterium]